MHVNIAPSALRSDSLFSFLYLMVTLWSSSGCAVSTAAQYETPLGNIEIDHEINEQLVNTVSSTEYPLAPWRVVDEADSVFYDCIAQGKFTTMSLDVDEDEHSIEMHLPFIFKVCCVALSLKYDDVFLLLIRILRYEKVMNGRKFTAVPILVGNTKTKMDQEYGKYVATSAHAS